MIEDYIKREIVRARQDQQEFHAEGKLYAAAFCQGIEFGLQPILQMLKDRPIT